MEFLSPRRRRLSWRNEVARSKEKRLFSQGTRAATARIFDPLKGRAFKCSVHTTLTVKF